VFLAVAMVRNVVALRQWLWSALAVSALVVGGVALVGAQGPSDAKVVVLAGSNVAVRPVSLSIPVTRRSRPVKLVIPAIGVSTSVGTLGLQPDHEVMVPTSIHTVGWYIDGPSPGQMGSAVILGHVDSYKGKGVFFNLKTLKLGDKITVTSSDGVLMTFKVTTVVQYSKSAFPDRLVYGSHGTRSLQLVTCGGVFDQATGHYESNIVVFSHLVSVTKPKILTVS
jgi:LPXTG-site transpeptidase (sortase) family protein